MAALMELRSVTKRFREGGMGGWLGRGVEAVREVSLSIPAGETFGIVGESGCGKSTVARLMMGLEQPTKGEVFFDGQRIDDMPAERLRALRPQFQMVFQDSSSSLNPRRSIGDLIRLPMVSHRTGGNLRDRVDELLETVGLPAAMAARYPHELSGGQRQRVCIARALSLNPRLLVLDEPVSALDVSVQAQILNLIRDLQARLGLTTVFIGHGLGAVRYVSQRIAVMYLGRVVEQGPAAAVFDHPAHPYTRALLDAAPSADVRLKDRARVVLKGEAEEEPPPGGCCLYHRCPRADAGCLKHDGALRQVAGQEGHLSACERGL